MAYTAQGTSTYIIYIIYIVLYNVWHSGVVWYGGMACGVTRHTDCSDEASGAILMAGQRPGPNFNGQRAVCIYAASSPGIEIPIPDRPLRR